jgi:hypothetical protein
LRLAARRNRLRVLFPRPYSSELGALTFDEVSNMRKLVRYCDGTLIAVIFIVGFFTYFVRGFDPVQREHLAEEQPHIVLTLDTTKTIEFSVFVGAFSSLGNECDRFIRQTSPNLAAKRTCLFARFDAEASLLI